MPVPFPVTVQIDASPPSAEPLEPIWRFFGCDEPNYAYLPHGEQLLAVLGSLGEPQVYFRTHNLLTSGDGTPALKWGSTNAYSEDAAGNPSYDWSILDRIFDSYLERGVKPFVQVGFMPRELSTHPEPYQHRWSPFVPGSTIVAGWAYPPKSYAKWGNLVRQWALHCVERYGRAEAESWYWEPWNEPNILYWQGSQAEYHRLYDVTMHALRSVLPNARLGGPDSAGADQWLTNFLEHCVRGQNFVTGTRGAPLDFVAFHAKGAPKFVDGHVRMGLAQHLRTIDNGFRIIASFPELAHTPVILGESDPEGCAACQGPELQYRNGTMYSSYTAASFTRKLDLAQRHGIQLKGALTWAFEFEDQAWFAGFRALATNGVELPVLAVFRLFGKLHGVRLPVESSGAVPLDTLLAQGVSAAPDVHALASRAERELSALLWHYHDDDVPGPDANITLAVTGLPEDGPVRIEHQRVDSEHSNAFAAWQRMGNPKQPSRAERAALEAAARLAQLPEPAAAEVSGGQLQLELRLPRQAVSLLTLSW